VSLRLLSEFENSGEVTLDPFDAID